MSTLDNGYYIDINDSWLHLLGFSRTETIGKSAIELGIWATPEDRETVKQLIQIDTTKSTGNGLGLAIVKRIVEAHGGELQIESSSQIGTQVRVQIPL